MVKEENYHKLKWIIGCLVIALGLIYTVSLNVIEIKKGNNMPQTVEASKLRNVDYFTDFSMETMDGDVFTQENLKGYKITVFNVWEPYCASCLKEMPDIDALADELKEEGIQIVNVNGYAYTSPEDNELAYTQMSERNIKMPKLLADEAFSNELLPVLADAFPGTFIVSEDGKILDFVSSSKSKDAWKQYFLEFVEE